MRIVLAVLVLVLKNFVVGSNTSYCNDIPNNSTKKLYVSQHFELKNISVYWDSEPAHAAASLLAAILHHVLGYQYVRLQQSPPHNQNTEATCQLDGQLKEVKLELSTARNTSDFIVQLEVKLQVHLAKQFQGEEQWANVTKWNFYNGTTNLTNYGFSYSNISGKLGLDVFIIEPQELNVRAMAEALTAQTKTSLLLLQFREINMTDYFHTFRTQNQSFLFLGYNMWADPENIKIVEVPIQTMNVNIAMHVADDCLLKELAPEIEIIAKSYKLSTEQLGQLLELETSIKNNEEAACKWISKYNTYVDLLVQKYDPDYDSIYTIVTVFCKDNPKQEILLHSLYQHLVNKIYDNYESKYNFNINDIGENCSDTNYVMENLLKNNYITPLTIGVILDGVGNVKEYNVAKALDELGVPVLVYNIADIDVDETTSVWLTSGRTLHIVLALHQLITVNNWKRFVVLSDPTSTAERYITELTQLGGLEIRKHKVERNIKQLDVEKILKSLKYQEYNTIFVNTNYEDAVTILQAAESLIKNETQNLTFILRDWRPNESIKNITHFTVSHSYSDAKNTSIIAKWEKTKDEWPALTTAFTDAIFLLLHGFDDVMNKYPQARYDTQSKEVIKEFERSFNDPQGIEGVFQNLKFKGHAVEETAVYLDEWQGNQRKRKARWSVNTTALAATVKWGSIDMSGCNKHLSHDGMLMAIMLSCLVQNYSFIW